MDTHRNCNRCGSRVAPGGGLQGLCMTCLMELGMESSIVVATGGSAPPFELPDHEELARQLDRYELGELLGVGGMGVVYRARQKGLERDVALKIVGRSRDPRFAERFTREARALAALDHANIVRVYDFGQAGEHWFLAMELVDGVNLRDVIRGRELSPREALRIVAEVCDALQYAHDEGVVHRDIKPENVLLDRKGRVKITDFGLAKLADRTRGEATLTGLHQVMGTPHYMAPEQIERPRDVDHRADIYSLGVVFYELLTGELPIGRFTPPSQVVALDVRLDEIVLRTLEKEPARRYQLASALKTDVERVSSSEAPAARATPARATPEPAAPAREPRRRRSGVGTAVAWGAGIVFVLALAFVGFAMLVAMQRGNALRDEEQRAVADALIQRPLPDLSVLDESGAPREQWEFLAAVHESYENAERSHAHVETPDGRTLHAAITPFPGILASLQASLNDALRREIRQDGRNSMLQISIARELFPFGGEHARIEIERIEGGYRWMVQVGERIDAQTGAELPPHLERVWGYAFVDPPPSALRATKLVLDVIDGARGEGATIELGELAAAPSRKGDVDVRFFLVIRAGDPVEASRRFDALQTALRAQPWCVAYDAPKTAELEQGTGIRTDRIALDVRLDDEPISIAGGLAPFDPNTTIRSLAQAGAHPLGALEISPSERRHSVEVVDLYYDIEPVQEAALPLAEALAFCTALEDVHPSARVTMIQLEPADAGADEEELPGRWTLDVGLTLRSPRF